MDKHILSCITEIMKMQIEAGAEVYRAEESGEHIARAYGAKVADVYATTSNIIISVEDENENMLTHTRRIKRISTDMDKVDRLNTLSRKLTDTPQSIEYIKKEIENIRSAKVYSAYVNIACYGGIAGVFCLFFGGRTISEFLFAIIIGLCVGLFNKAMTTVDINKFLTRFLCSFVACFLAFVFFNAKLIATVDFVIIGNIMTLIPGIGLTNSLRDLFTGDSISGTLRLIEALLLALAIGGGYIVAAFLLGGIV